MAVATTPSASISAADREVLRRLAHEVAALAARPLENEKRDLWRRHNDLEPTRPLVFCSPENAWYEIVPLDSLQCKSDLARGWEFRLRLEQFWGASLRDDRVIEPHFDVHLVYTESDFGMHETKIGGDHGGSYVWDAPLKSYDDLHQLRFPVITIDRETTAERLALAEETLGDIMPVRQRTFWILTPIMTWTVAKLRGLEQLMLDMCLYPEGLHQLMAFLRDAFLAKLDFLEQNNLLELNNDSTYVGSGGFGYTAQLPQKDFNPARVRTIDVWGACESQETTSVSPAQFEEFVFQYQVPIMERFGLNCYGCCEPLDLRWHIVKKSPHLRRVSVSPWANLKFMAECLTDQYVYSMKPNPATMATPAIDEDFIRKGLREALDITRDCRVEVIMKDTHTCGNNPENLVRWCRIAREEADRIAG